MTVDVSRFMDPDEMIDSEVTGVTEESNRFVRASNLLNCENCSNTGLHPAEIAAVRPRNHAVMLCKKCMQEPPGEWL